jgi:hypothetical protein
MNQNVEHQSKTTEKCEMIFPGSQKGSRMSDHVSNETIKEDVGKANISQTNNVGNMCIEEL